MRHRLLSLIAVGGIWLLSMGVMHTSAAPAADYGHAVFLDGSVRGIVQLRYTGTTTVNAGVLGLTASEEFFVIGRTIGCGGSPSAANRVFRVTAMTDSNGTLNLSKAVTANRLVRSFWIGGTGGGQERVCQFSLNYTKLELVGDWNSDGRDGLVKTGPGTLAAIAVVERRSNDQARLALWIDGLDAGNTYRAQFVDGKCGKPGGPTFASYRLENVLVSGFKSKTVPMTQDELDAMGSVRVTDTTTGQKFMCVPLGIIMANTEGD